MGLTVDVDSAIQAPTLLTTSSQGALFLPEMSIKTGTIVLGNTYIGTSVTIMILKHPRDGMNINLYTPKKYLGLLFRTERTVKAG